MISFVKSSNYGRSILGADGTGIVTFPGGNTNGNIIVVGIFTRNSLTDLTTGVSDTEGNTYVRIAGAPENDSNNVGFYVFYYAVVTNGSNGLGPDNVISVSCPAGNTVFKYNVVACEYTGVRSVSPFDVSSGSGNLGANSLTYGITLSTVGELIVSIAAFQGSGQNWTGISGAVRAGSDILQLACFYDVVSSLSGLNIITATDLGLNAYPAGFSISLFPFDPAIPSPKSEYGMRGKRTFGNLIGG